jgi:hypothetical protein
MRERTQQAMIGADRQAIRCASCALPSVEIGPGVLIVRNKHHGQVHENTFSLAWIKQLIEASERQILADIGAQQ